jgi:hypothetical protein
MLVAAAAATFVVALAGCTMTPPQPTTAPRLVTTTTDALSGMEALMIATLSVDDEGCVVARTDGSSASVIWPLGYTAVGSNDSFEVLDADGDTIAVSGVALAFGGGGVDAPDLAWANVDCVTNAIWIVGGVSEP